MKRSRSRSRSPLRKRRGGERTPPRRRSVWDEVRAVDEADAYEAMAEGVGSAFDLAVALCELSDATVGAASPLPDEARHVIFRTLLSKAVEYFTPDLVVDVLAYTDRYYRALAIRTLDAEVHDYITRVINHPVPTGVRRLLGRIIDGNGNRYDTMFSASGEGQAVVSRPETWVKYVPSLAEETAKLIRWVDSRCANDSYANAAERIKSYFREPKREDDAEGAVGDAIATESLSVDLTCPLSKTRIVIPACGRNTQHIQPFDLEHFLSVNLQRQRSLAEQGKDPAPWKCPVTNQTVDEDSLIVCPFFSDILAKVPSYIRTVVVSKDASWREEAAAADPADHSCIVVEDGPFNPKYDVVVKAEPQ